MASRKIGMRRKKGLNILLAEDNRSDAALLSKIIEDAGHKVIVANDGLKALEIYFSEPVDLVVLDINLPGMNGLDVAESIREDIRPVPIIFTTATFNSHMLKECFDASADDFFTKPFQAEMVQIKLRSFARILNMRSVLETQRDLIAGSNRSLILEQEAARRIFDKLSDDGNVNDPNLRYSLNALSIFNGDIILSSKGPGGELYVFLGDFTGHGLVASLSSMPLIQTFYRMVEKGFSMAMILQEINARLYKTLPTDIFCCASMVMMDPRKQEVQVWNGGMPTGYLFLDDSLNYEPVESKHVPLGVLDSNSFRLKIENRPMNKGGRFLMCSDGVLEARSASNQMFGGERFEAVLENAPEGSDVFDQVLSAVENFTQGAMGEDDVSLVEVRMPDEVEPVVTKTAAAPKRENDKHGNLSGNLSYTITPEMMRANNPIPALLQMVLEVPGLREVRSELFTACTELYANALDHGVLGLDSELKKSAEGFDKFYRLRQEKLNNLTDASISFDFKYESHKGSGEVMIRVKDSGPGFDVAAWQKKQDAKNAFSGRGIALIQQISHSMEIHEPGNDIEMTLKW